MQHREFDVAAFWTLDGSAGTDTAHWILMNLSGIFQFLQTTQMFLHDGQMCVICMLRKGLRVHRDAPCNVIDSHAFTAFLVTCYQRWWKLSLAVSFLAFSPNSSSSLKINTWPISCQPPSGYKLFSYPNAQSWMAEQLPVRKDLFWLLMSQGSESTRRERVWARRRGTRWQDGL